MQLDNMGMGDAFDDVELLGDHLFLVLGYFIETDHLYRVILLISLLYCLENL